MPDFTVRTRGVDTSGRPLRATAYMWAWWDRVCDDLGFTPTIVQGAFMAGHGADASAGYHDQGGCFDLRVWNLGPTQVEDVIRTCRELGAAAWLRDHRHGMDPHIHLLLGSDRPLDSGAAYQWRQYLAGRDGLAGNGPDYHWRPSPLVTTPPPEDDMANYAEQLNRIETDVEAIKARLDEVGANTKKRDRAAAERAAKRHGVAVDKLNAILDELDDEG